LDRELCLGKMWAGAWFYVKTSQNQNVGWI